MAQITDSMLKSLTDELERLRAENAAFKADIEAGRLVMFPLVPHDKVWYIDGGDVLPGVVTSIEKVPNAINPGVWRVWGINASGIDGNDNRFCRHMNSRFREEVFTTEEAARAALQEGNKG